jgi:hypothetical protein
MAEAIIGPLVGRLQEIAVGEARALVAVNDDIQRLRDKLMWLHAFLREADTRRRAVSDEITMVWLNQTRDAVFDARTPLIITISKCTSPGIALHDTRPVVKLERRQGCTEAPHQTEPPCRFPCIAGLECGA